MLNDNAKQWVAALRSGDYKQGRGCLRTVDNEYCCLGVACDLAEKAGITKCEQENGTLLLAYEGNYIDLPQSVKEWLGLDTSGGTFIGASELPSWFLNDHQPLSLMFLNDHQQKSFAEIADVIESEPQGLFADGNSTR